MERGGTLAFIGDQNAFDKGLFVPFFDRLASAYKSIALLAIGKRFDVTSELMAWFFTFASTTGEASFVFADSMAAVDTEGVEPMSHPQEAMQRLREDAVSEADRRDQFQAVAPKVEDGLYLVPRVIE